MRLARTIVNPFNASTDIGFQWLENGATCILIGFSVEDVNDTWERASEGIVWPMDYSWRQKSVLSPASILVHKLASRDGVARVLRHKKCQRFLDTLKICWCRSGNDNIIPLTIKRLQDLRWGIFCRYLGRHRRIDPIVRTVVFHHRLGVALGLVTSVIFFYVAINSHILCSRRYSSKERIVEASKWTGRTYVP